MAEDNGIEPVINETPIDPLPLNEPPPGGNDSQASGGGEDLDQIVADLRAENERLTQRAQIVDAFDRNPEGVIRDVAQRMGLELTPIGRQGGSAQDDNPPPAQFVDTVTQNLPPEMQFMGDSLARASWAAHQQAMQPFQQQLAQDRQQRFNSERDAIVSEMDQKHPNWRDRVNDMEEIFNFIQSAGNSGAMRHPKHGTLQELLFKLAAGDSGAVRTAANRMQAAAQNASSTSSNTGSPRVDVAEQIKQTNNQQDKWSIALNAALAEHGMT